MSGKYRPVSGKAVTHPRQRARRERALARRKQNVVDYTAGIFSAGVLGLEKAKQEVAILEERLA